MDTQRYNRMKTLQFQEESKYRCISFGYVKGMDPTRYTKIK